ncbi:MAG: type II secretion system protein GspE [Candidatus Omnitrophica bacterium]|nr:type II secretion system protein GspE [Candidatus Omnitrophota bacterium]
MASRDAHNIKDVLLREGVVTFQLLNEIIAEQEKSNIPILELLVRKKEFDSKKLLLVYTGHYGYTPVNPAIFVLDDELLNLIPKAIAEKFLVLPISLFDKTLTVAFANPTNLKAVDELQAITHMRIKVVAADAKLIPPLIAKNYEKASASALAVLTEAAIQKKEEKLDDIVKMIEVEQDDSSASESDLLKGAFETPVIKIVNNLLAESIQRRASDIFIEPWEDHIRVRSRVDGMLEEVIRTPKSLGDTIVSRIKVMSQLNIAEHRVPQDGRFKVKTKKREVDLRVSILPTTFGEKVCLRILDTSSQAHDISKLGFNEREQTVIKDCSQSPHGMILVTGPTGSGKTTTLYSVLRYLDSPDVNITTVEDPVEYQLPGINQVNVKEQVGLTFPASLRSILRQDPDIILIGEIRDADTLDIAVKAALTGHLVLSTLHTNDAISSIVRMANMGLEPFLIASTVLMISAQRLVRRVCQKCKIEDEVTELVLKDFGLEEKSDVKFYKGRGCGQCRQSGYSGRSVVTEIARMTPMLRELIMKGEGAEDIKLFARSQGMTTLRESAIEKGLAGETTIDEIFRVTTSDQDSKKAPRKEKAA